MSLRPSPHGLSARFALAFWSLDFGTYIILIFRNMFLSTILVQSFLSFILLQPTNAAPSSYQWQQSLSNSASPDWQKYVRSPSTYTVRPAAVLTNYTQGNVTNPQGLLTGRGATTFTRTNVSAGTEKDVPPTIVVDFGQNTVGVLSIKFGGASSFNDTPGLPGIRLAFSETLEFLTNVSDFSRSYNVTSLPFCRYC